MKKSLILGYALALIFLNSIATAQDQEAPVNVDLEHDLNFDAFAIDDMLLESSDTAEAKIACIPPQDLASLLVSLGILNVLSEQLFLATHPLTTRSLLDLPFFNPQHPHDSSYFVGTHAFWDSTERMHFSRTSSSLCSYLAITSPTLMDKLASFINTNLPGSTLNPATVLPLFQNMTVNERKAGFMMLGQYQGDRLRCTIKFPLYYLERNFYVTEQEQDAIERILGQTSDKEQMDFAEKHLINDQLGLGNTRVLLDYQLDSLTAVDMRVGGYITLPTAGAFAKGLKGTNFEPPQQRPQLDLAHIFMLACGTACEQEQALSQVQSFMLGALDNFGAMVLHSGLDTTHANIAATMSSETPLSIFIKRPWAANVVLRSYVAFEYDFPYTTTRFFVVCNDTVEFDALNLNRSNQAIDNDIRNDPTYAAAVLGFIEQQIVDRFYPYAFSTRIHPGCLFQWTSKTCYEADRWGLTLGNDLWVRTPEQLTAVDKVGPRPINLACHKAKREFAYQSRLTGSIFYKIPRETHDLTLGINAESAYMSAGIGKDFAVSLSLEANF